MIRQALSQDRTVFTRRTWASTTTYTIKTPNAQHFKTDTPHEDYKTPPPWEPLAIKITIHSLPESKARLSKNMLADKARKALQLAPALGIDVCCTDGSVDPQTTT
ncbi:hypothetical protein E2C01_073094 [Portunus trituberculatus]|uniref:Uncharacterized protein n=1 Tax=Portunus trituberculatus TaxID=210409 RepID=A0A5B7I4B3_PORTR|nr:hypothetical protein [Portunus trituberculatus]